MVTGAARLENMRLQKKFTIYVIWKHLAGLSPYVTSYAMATKFAQDKVRANSNNYRYFDVTVTWYDVIMTSFVSQSFT